MVMIIETLFSFTERCVHQNCVVKLSGRGRDVNGLHLLETSEGVAFWHKLGDRPLVEGAGDQQNDVVNHVAVCDVVQERSQRSGGMVPHVLELGDELLFQLVVDDADLQRARDIGQEVPVVGALQVELQICEYQTAYVEMSNYRFFAQNPSYLLVSRIAQDSNSLSAAGCRS